MKPHKHAEVIRSYADGAIVQVDKGGEWVDMSTPSFHDCLEYRIKPAAPKWPETTMTNEQIEKSVKGYFHTSPEIFNRARTIINAALRHSVETGQLVTKEAHESAIQSRDEVIETLRACVSRKSDRISELRADRADRDKAIAEAVAHAYQHAKYTIAGPDAVDLAAIIAGVAK